MTEDNFFGVSEQGLLFVDSKTILSSKTSIMPHDQINQGFTLIKNNFRFLR